ncbi:MAG: anaerobic ribonucleoside-triphosphate reductase activating protein, partial [Patescibacteria group bacterium]|nr:anaerobic ribonucleoside-triphosphate reductase activating protein [Patescibacteria group bacterium]
ESITLIMGAGIDYEFRTTVLPRYHNLSDFEEIGKLIKGAKKYVIQGFRDEVVLDEKLKSTKKFAAKELEKIKSTLENYVKEVGIRENI